MPETVSLIMSPQEAANSEEVLRALVRKIGRQLDADRFVIIRRSLDSRKRAIRVNLGIRVYADGEAMAPDRPNFCYRDVRSKTPVVIVGAGPAGLFAALQLVELGFRPVVIERGKPVKGRRRDVAALNRRGMLNHESNYAFGEGGAGTFSDGKLYTRSKKRGDHRRVLHRFHQHGADERILMLRTLISAPIVSRTWFPPCAPRLKTTAAKYIFSKKLLDCRSQEVGRRVCYYPMGVASRGVRSFWLPDTVPGMFMKCS
jgi:uncharacterized FAD-dependent dehydrogenase